MNDTDNERVLMVTIWNPALKDTYTPDEILDLLDEGHEFRRVCPFCGSDSHIKDASVVYGDSYSGTKLLVCDSFPLCDSYVGVHKQGYKEGEPLGTLANKPLRELRKICHNDYFDPLWKEQGMTRKEAYSFMSNVMGKPAYLSHIAMFSLQDCQSFISLMMNRKDWDLDYAKEILKRPAKIKKGWDAVAAQDPLSKPKRRKL